MSTITTTTRRNGTSAPQATPKATPKATAIVEVKPHLIRRRAYEIFLARNGGPGDHVSDWIQAEQELHRESEVTPIAVRTGDRRGKDDRSGVHSQPIRDGILDNH